jgi:hypothetical protein
LILESLFPDSKLESTKRNPSNIANGSARQLVAQLCALPRPGTSGSLLFRASMTRKGHRHEKSTEVVCGPEQERRHIMHPHVTLQVVKGHLEEPAFDFEQPAHCVVGRADDCDVHVVPDLTNITVSRHHCELDINPPHVRVRDLGSLYGTFVNGECIGHRSEGQHPDEAAPSDVVRDLNDGDELQVGEVVMRVGIEEKQAEDQPVLVPLMFF